jgi:hypothetical protein
LRQSPIPTPIDSADDAGGALPSGACEDTTQSETADAADPSQAAAVEGDCENDLRGTLRNFGLKVGTVKFEARIKELVENLPDLAVLVEPLLIVRRALREQIVIRRGRRAKNSPADFSPSGIRASTHWAETRNSITRIDKLSGARWFASGSDFADAAREQSPKWCHTNRQAWHQALGPP